MNRSLARLRHLRRASLAEGATLPLLLGVAAPLKRMAGFPEAVAVLGPIHGAAFLICLALVLRAWQAGV